jgi:hypothetical protein
MHRRLYRLFWRIASGGRRRDAAEANGIRFDPANTEVAGCEGFRVIATARRDGERLLTLALNNVDPGALLAGCSGN